MSLIIEEKGEQEPIQKPVESGSLSSRKDLLQSTTKFMNENLSMLTLCNAKSTSFGKEDQREIKHLNLLYFKITKCDKPNCSDIKNCPLYHSDSDRRRSLMYCKYVSDMCPNVSKNSPCPHRDGCKYSHNHFESLYHHSKYKKRFCNSYPDRINTCKYHNYCSYAHSEEEIQIVLLHNYTYDKDFFVFHYKTQFCPFNFIEHNRSGCVYAHNWQDLRRAPHENRIYPAQCETWKEKEFLQHYSDGCPKGSKCMKCHGWKELDFHPLNYKRQPCQERNCNKNEACPNFHSEADKRNLPKSVLNADFTPIPCNRLVTGLHKVPVVSDNRLPSLEDIDESHKQSPNTKKLSHASSKKQVLTVPKNEENESSDEDLEGVQPKSTTSLNKLSEQKYTGSSRDNLADIQEEEEPIHSPKIEKNHSKENIENQQKSFSKIKISQVVSEEKKMPPGENS